MDNALPDLTDNDLILTPPHMHDWSCRMDYLVIVWPRPGKLCEFDPSPLQIRVVHYSDVKPAAELLCTMCIEQWVMQRY
jgi:hypothetical protein